MVTIFNSNFTLKDCLFGGVKLAKNADPDKCIYSGYNIVFYLRSEFSLPDGRVGKNVIIFQVHMSSSVHIDNKGKDILTLGKGPTQGLYDNMSTVEAQYSISFLRSNRKLCKACIIMGATAFYLLMLQKYIISKQNILK